MQRKGQTERVKVRSCFELFEEHENNKLLQIKRRFSRMDLFSKMECAGGTWLMRDIDRKRFLKKMQLIYFEGLVQ